MGSLVIYFILGFVATAIGWFAYKVYILPYYLSPLRNIPGPPSESLISGNFRRFFAEEAGEAHVKWIRKYGNFVKYHGLLNQPAVIVTDANLIREILLNQAYDFAKFILLFRSDRKYITGIGISQVEGNVHKKQRKVMNPVFAHSIIKNMAPTLVHVALTLKGLVEDKVNKGESKIILSSYMSKAALDVIGLVGFNHEFNSLTSKSALAEAYSTFMSEKINVLSFMISVLSLYVPSIRKLPMAINKRYNNTREIIERETKKVMDEKYIDDKNNKLDRIDLFSRLFSINKTFPIEEKMTDEELRNQIMVILLAGHETTSNSISWSLHMLAQHPNEQDLLREELVKAFPDKSKFNPTIDEINSLEYLNCIVKEVLRLYPPVVVIQRYSLKDNQVLGEHIIPKGTSVDIPVAALHKLPSIWGPTADDFDPKRWLNPSLIKNVTNYNYLPFGAGVRSCIGNKMALNEIKIILSILVRNYIFQPVEGLHVKRRTGILNKPSPYLELNVSKVEV